MYHRDVEGVDQDDRQRIGIELLKDRSARIKWLNLEHDTPLAVSSRVLLIRRQHPIAPAENKWRCDIHGRFPEGIVDPINQDSSDEGEIDEPYSTIAGAMFCRQGEGRGSKDQSG